MVTETSPFVESESRIFIIFEGACPEPGCPGEVEAISIGGIPSFLDEQDGYDKSVPRYPWKRREDMMERARELQDYRDFWAWEGDTTVGNIEFKCSVCERIFVVAQNIHGDWNE